MYNNSSGTVDLGLVDSPLYFIRSGMIALGAIQSQTCGFYMSSTLYDQNSDYFIMFANNQVVTANSATGWWSRSGGKTVRCVVR